MSNIRFEWDARKAKSNLRKHGVSFEAAQSVFYNENARLIEDPDHSEDEDRFILLGMSSNSQILIVCHCYRENEEVIRIISARKATSFEQTMYRNNL